MQGVWYIWIESDLSCLIDKIVLFELICGDNHDKIFNRDVHCHGMSNSTVPGIWITANC